MRLWSVIGNSQRLDGGAMFGNAPQALWRRWIEPDAENRIPLATRALLIEDAGRYILFETGIGAFFPPDRRERYGVQEAEHVLLGSLADCGIAPEEIDVVVLSHLHFDHAGGLLTRWRSASEPQLCFPRATFVVGRRAWERACRPHRRDRASFIPELPALLQRSGRLRLVNGVDASLLGSRYRFYFSDGHTPGLMMTEVETPAGPLLFASDLIPGRPWVHLPITMGYDRYPEKLVDEKSALLHDLLERRGSLFFTHDAEIAVARVARDDRGRFTVSDDRVALDGG